VRPGATRVESLGSVWFFDEDAREYLRMPKNEGPRSSPEGEDWGGPTAGPLEDLTWHPYEQWAVVPKAFQDILVISVPDSDLGVVAPITEFDIEDVLGRWDAASCRPREESTE
jgi:hypothetical protein